MPNEEAIIGTVVEKISGKPFKSGLKTATVKGVTTNPHIGRPAYTFEEDDSVVNIEMCRPATKE